MTRFLFPGLGSVAVLFFYSIFSGLADAGKGENAPPRVTISTPKDGGNFAWNTLLRYQIEVSDREDGESKYGEIASHEVYLEVVFQPGGAASADKIGAREQDPPGLARIKESDCLSCHASRAAMTGPSFYEIAHRYASGPASVKMLSKRIIEGSSGIWGNALMPPHPSLNPEQAAQIVEWILKKGKDPHYRLFRGVEGTFRTRKPPESGAGGQYRLTATYTDHGLEGQSEGRKQGRHTIILTAR